MTTFLPHGSNGHSTIRPDMIPSERGVLRQYWRYKYPSASADGFATYALAVKRAYDIRKNAATTLWQAMSRPFLDARFGESLTSK